MLLLDCKPPTTWIDVVNNSLPVGLMMAGLVICLVVMLVLIARD